MKVSSTTRRWAFPPQEPPCRAGLVQLAWLALAQGTRVIHYTFIVSYLAALYVCSLCDEDEDVFYEEDKEYTIVDPEKIKAGFEGWVIYGRDQFQCKVTSKNKKKKTAFVKFYLEDGLSKQKQLVNLSDFIVVEEEEFDY